MATPAALQTADPQLDSLLVRLRDRANAKKNENTQKDVEDFSKVWVDSDDGLKARQSAAHDMTRKFYNLVTDFYEYGWGESFHFFRQFKGDKFAANMARHELFLALKLNLQPGMTVLDCGCGVGGPAREIAKSTGVNIQGITINEYQVNRFKVLSERKGLANLCKVRQGNFLEMPFEDNSFDATYAIEATCHAPNPAAVYQEIYRTLKPGALFACYEWCVTEKYDENDPEQKKIIFNIEEGNSLPKLARTTEVIKALEKVGFEVVEAKDLAAEVYTDAAQEPWYSPLQGEWTLQPDRIMNWRMTPVGRWITHKLVSGLETARLAPPGTSAITSLLNMAADYLVMGGEKGIFTPMFFFLVRKPESPVAAAS